MVGVWYWVGVWPSLWTWWFTGLILASLWLWVTVSQLIIVIELITQVGVMLIRTDVGDWRFNTRAEVIFISLNTEDDFCSGYRDVSHEHRSNIGPTSVHLDDDNIQTIVTPKFKPFTIIELSEVRSYVKSSYSFSSPGTTIHMLSTRNQNLWDRGFNKMVTQNWGHFYTNV